MLLKKKAHQIQFLFLLIGEEGNGFSNNARTIEISMNIF